MKMHKPSQASQSKDKAVNFGESPSKDTLRGTTKEDKDAITKCMSGPFNDMVYRFRYYIIVLFVILGIGGLIVATHIGPMTENQPMLPDDHPLITTQKLIGEEFSAASGEKENFIINIVWGVKDLDRSSVGLWKSEEMGRLVWDDDFTIEPAEN